MAIDKTRMLSDMLLLLLVFHKFKFCSEKLDIPSICQDPLSSSHWLGLTSEKEDNLYFNNRFPFVDIPLGFS